MENWKDINGYEGIYEINEYGFIKNIITNRVLMPELLKANYYRITLSKDSKIKRFAVHRLVAQHFLDNPKNKKEVHHIDRKTLNNHFSNLMWVTKKEHLDIHGYDNLQNHNNENKIKVDMYELNGKFVKTFDSIRESAIYILTERNCELTKNKIGGIISKISSICRGVNNRKSYYGYTWKHVKEGL